MTLTFPLLDRYFDFFQISKKVKVMTLTFLVFRKSQGHDFDFYGFSKKSQTHDFDFDLTFFTIFSFFYFILIKKRAPTAQKCTKSVKY
jgi:hypothetical protein